MLLPVATKAASHALPIGLHCVGVEGYGGSGCVGKLAGLWGRWCMHNQDCFATTATVLACAVLKGRCGRRWQAAMTLRHLLESKVKGPARSLDICMRTYGCCGAVGWLVGVRHVTDNSRAGADF